MKLKNAQWRTLYVYFMQNVLWHNACGPLEMFSLSYNSHEIHLPWDILIWLIEFIYFPSFITGAPNSKGQCGANLVHHWARARKNYSFSNNEVRNIEHENQRLLRELTRISEGPKPGSAQVKKAYANVNTPLTKISHHGLNRLREQKRIERENLVGSSPVDPHHFIWSNQIFSASHSKKVLSTCWCVVFFLIRNRSIKV